MCARSGCATSDIQRVISRKVLRDKERPVPRLSIIIPCLGGGAEFDGTLVSVLQNRPADCEVIVAHTDDYGDPYALRGEVEFVHGSAAVAIAPV